MKILIAEDDPVSRRLLVTRLTKWGFEIVVTQDGNTAWQRLQETEAPRLAILDWMMPGLSGVEICCNVRANPATRSIYLMLLTARDSREDLLSGLAAGADDYVTKPCDAEELLARIRVGERILNLQRGLADRVRELEAALEQVKKLQGLLPICLYCKKIRNDKNYWQQVESYIMDHSGARFSHGICPECYEKVVKPQLAQLKNEADDPTG